MTKISTAELKTKYPDIHPAQWYNWKVAKRLSAEKGVASVKHGEGTLNRPIMFYNLEEIEAKLASGEIGNETPANKRRQTNKAKHREKDIKKVLGDREDVKFWVKEKEKIQAYAKELENRIDKINAENILLKDENRMFKEDVLIVHDKNHLKQVDELQAKIAERNLKIMHLSNELKIYKDGILNQFKTLWSVRPV